MDSDSVPRKKKTKILLSNTVKYYNRVLISVQNLLKKNFLYNVIENLFMG